MFKLVGTLGSPSPDQIKIKDTFSHGSLKRTLSAGKKKKRSKLLKNGEKEKREQRRKGSKLFEETFSKIFVKPFF